VIYDSSSYKTFSDFAFLAVFQLIEDLANVVSGLVYYLEPAVLTCAVSMSTGAKATIRLRLPSEKQATALLDALKPEAFSTVTRRASVKIKKDKLFLVLSVDAEDTVALRSTLNAYLRWIGATLNVISFVEQT